MHFYAWKAGLKTGMYYLRSRPRTDAIQFTVDKADLDAARRTVAVVSGDYAAGKPVLALGSGATGGGAGGSPAAAPAPLQALVVPPLSSPNTPAGAAAASGGGCSTDSSADSSRAGSPVPMVGFLTPTASRTAPVGKAASEAAQEAAGELAPSGAMGGSPGQAEEDARLMAVAAQKAAERKKAREELENMDGGSDVCLNCGS
jgi:hypothetical protein